MCAHTRQGARRAPWGTPQGYPLDVLMTRRVMVITRVTYYKCKAPPRTYHYVTLRDKVHLTHLWSEDQTKHICGLAQASRGRRPHVIVFPDTRQNKCWNTITSERHLRWSFPFRLRISWGVPLNVTPARRQMKRSWKDIFALFSGPAPILPL